MAKLLEIDDSTFQQTVLAAAGPVLVDFTAAWCPPCKLLAPILEELQGEYAGRLLFTTLDTDENNESAARHGVQNMPTLVLFWGGREVQRIVGYAPKAKLQQQIDRALTASSAPVGPTHG